MNKRKIVTFLITTFGISWILFWLLAFLKQDDSQIFSNMLYFVMFFIGGLTPAIASYFSIKFTDKNYKVFNKSVLKWCVNIIFYLFCIVVIFGVRYLAIVIYGFVFKPILWDLTPQFIALLPLFVIMIPLGGLEELGWRGLLFPELCEKYNILISGSIVGLIWALWHLPLFFIKGLSHYHSDFIHFSIQTIGLGLVLAWLYKRTKSIFICVFFHALYNTSTSIGLSCPNDGRYITAIIWLLLGGGLLIIENRKDRKKLRINGS